LRVNLRAASYIRHVEKCLFVVREVVFVGDATVLVFLIPGEWLAG